MTYALHNIGTSTTGSGTINLVMHPVVELPVLRGNGPVNWSTCTDLDLTPRHIHDGNGYYRALGFSWPFKGITRRMLRLAYLERAKGTQDVENVDFLTYAMTMLLDEETRRLYHRVPLGHRMWDKYVWAEAMRAAKSVAAEAAARREELDVQDILSGWGIPTEPNEPVVDAEEPLGDDAQNPSAVSEGDDTVPDTWAWGYYLWRSVCEDTDRLGRWQEHLLAASRELGLRAQLGVGFLGRQPQKWIIGRVPACFVVLLHEDVEPSEELAVSAVSEVIRMINSNHP